MASTVSSTLRPEEEALSPKTMYFQRSKAAKRVKRKKKELKLTFKHIVLSFFLIGGIFFTIQQAYLFLISWDYLKIKEVSVVCPEQLVKQEVEQIIRRQPMGNILLFNSDELCLALRSQTLVKDAQIRKVFPSLLRVEIVQRQPIAIVKKENYYLVDEEGVELEKLESTEGVHLPLLIDSGKFHKNSEEKLSLAWECLKTLSELEKEKINYLDLSEFGRITLGLKDVSTRIILGQSYFAENLRYFSERQQELETRFGPLEYIDFRFEDRIYFKPRTGIQANVIPSSGKEGQ